MRYQLVLQWSSSPLASYDTLIETENLLVDKLSNQSEIDGHDIGSDEMNIFILTDDPQASFEQVKVILESRDIWADIRAAYREVSGNNYTILWPKNLTQFEVA